MIELVPLTLIVFYLIPFLVAAGRHHDSLALILVANIVIGWTVIGWFFVLWLALRGPSQHVATVLRSPEARRHLVRSVPPAER